MKRKFSKILGVGLALSLLVGLLMVAAPVLADVSQPTVALDDETISAAEEYIVTFVPSDQLEYDAVAADNGTITVRFPDDTEVLDGAWAAADFTISASPGWVDGVWEDCEVNDVTAVGDEDDLTVVFSLGTGTVGAGPNSPDDVIGEGATVRIVFESTGAIVNPSEPGTYTLEVMTSEEDDYVESAEYDIDAPTVGGFVYVRNASNVLLATYGGEDALIDAEAGLHFNRDDATIEVGEGTYLLTQDLNINGEGITLVSAEGTDDTVIDADGWSIVIAGDEVIVEDFTIDDAGTAVAINASEVILRNCVITDADIGVEVQAGAITDVDVTDNVIEDCDDGIVFAAGGGDLDDCDISGNEITGADGRGAIVFEGGNDDIDIKNNTITGNEVAGILFLAGGAACNNIDITGNTISENDADGIWIDTANAPTDLVIKENTIANNEDAGLNVDSWEDESCVFMLNDIYDNDDSIDTAVNMTNAIFNWWGSDDEDEIEDMLAGAGDVEYEPWLMDEVANVSAGAEIEVGDGDVLGAVDPVTSLDGKDDAGVNVTGIEDDDGNGADIISAFKYAANPQDDIDDAIAFYDVFMIVNDEVALDEVSGKLKFYDSAFNEGSVASFWTGDFWAECSEQLARAGVVYVDLTEDTVPSFDEMGETAFVVVSGEVEEGLDEPAIIAPEAGAADVALRPTFAWGAVDDADGYEFELADNAGFMLPMASFTGELGMLTSPAYAYRTQLPYATAYYWRVKAIGDDEESDWVSSVFVTMEEPEEEAPPVVVEEITPPQITIEPIVEVITPAATMVTPGWIYVIIGVGAVLVIALLVLIVRTRRVA